MSEHYPRRRDCAVEITRICTRAYVYVRAVTIKYINHVSMETPVIYFTPCITTYIVDNASRFCRRVFHPIFPRNKVARGILKYCVESRSEEFKSKRRNAGKWRENGRNEAAQRREATRRDLRLKRVHLRRKTRTKWNSTYGYFEVSVSFQFLYAHRRKDAFISFLM